MRIDEKEIFGAYMASLLVEKKKKGLPPWLKDKKDEKKDDKEEKSDKKSDKKGKKGKKGLPPWLKGKKKNLKESMDDAAPDIEDMRMSIMSLLDNTDYDTMKRVFDLLAGEPPAAEPADMPGADINTDGFDPKVEEDDAYGYFGDDKQ